MVIYVIHRMREDGELNAYDNESASVIRLNNSTVLYLREVNRYVWVYTYSTSFALLLKTVHCCRTKGEKLG